jgi:hypothetical protein
VYSSPAIDANSTVYVASLDGIIYALHWQDASQTLTVKWSFQTGRQGAPVTGINSSPAIGADSTVYIADSGGKIYAFNSPEPGSVDDDPSSQTDLKAPQISCPGDMTVSATGARTRVSFTATAADDVDLETVIAYSPDPGSEFSLGKTAVNVTATDSSGNSNTCSFQVTVKDTEPPRITCPADITVSAATCATGAPCATGTKTRVDFKAAQVMDNVDPSPKVVYDHESGSEFPVGTTLVKVIATDFSKNSSTCSFRVTVKDTEPPRITCPDITVSATGQRTVVPFTAAATDNVDTNPQVFP